MQSQNPLINHFRQPAVFLKLPSGGRYWAPNSLNLPANGEIGVMPMTAKDEIMLRTPDALMNGEGVVSVIQSCCPNILNAWGMPVIDSDAILIAIRIATYGNEMDIDSACPKCKHENRHQLGLGDILIRIKSPNYQKTIEVEGLSIKFKPLSYMQSNQNNIINFEQDKIIQLLANEDIDSATRKIQFDAHLQKIIDTNINTLAQSTESITTEQGVIVNDYNFINEFYTNANNGTIKTIQKSLQELVASITIPPARVQCEGCNEQYNVNVTFDYANFFVPLS